MFTDNTSTWDYIHHQMGKNHEICTNFLCLSWTCVTRTVFSRRRQTIKTELLLHPSVRQYLPLGEAEPRHFCNTIQQSTPLHRVQIDLRDDSTDSKFGFTIQIFFRRLVRRKLWKERLFDNETIKKPVCHNTPMLTMKQIGCKLVRQIMNSITQDGVSTKVLRLKTKTLILSALWVASHTDLFSILNVYMWY